MAFAAGTIWENWTTGATTNGGGFDPTNANFATDLAATSANGSSPVVSSASYTFVAGDVGAWLFIQSGTNWTPGWYQIASVASNQATLTAGIGTAVLYGTTITALGYHRPSGLIAAAGCATTASPTAGVWSVDYSQQAAAKITYTDMVIGVTTTQFTSVANPVGPNLVGNTINVTSGTGFTVQRVQVISFTLSGLIATCDKTLGTTASTGGNGKLGGAIGSTSKLDTLALTVLVAGNKIYHKATGTITETTTTTVNAATKGDATNGRISVEGYTTYRGQRDGRPLITSATNSVALFTLNDNDYFEFIHFQLTHTAATRGIGFSMVTSTTGPFWLEDSIVDGCLEALDTGGLTSVVSHTLKSCEVKNCTGTMAVQCQTNLYLYGCDIHDNAGDGVKTTQTASASNIYIESSWITKNAIGINDAVASTSATSITLKSSVVVDNTSDGVKIAANSISVGSTTLDIDNNTIYGNGGWGINNLDDQAGTDATVRINRNNAFGNNTSGAVTGMTRGLGDIDLSGDPFVSRASRNYAPNPASAAGLQLINAAFPTANIAGTTTTSRAIGVADAAASGGPVGQSAMSPVFF